MSIRFSTDYKKQHCYIKHCLRMSILQNFGKIQRIFYLLGLAPCHLSALNGKHKSFARIIPVLISFLSSICVAALQFKYFYLRKYGEIYNLLNFAFYGCLFLSNITANWQCLCYKSTYENIIHRIQQLERKFNFKFTTKILYKSINLRYTITAASIVGSFTISTAVVLGQSWSISDNSTRAILLACLSTFKEFMCALAILHFTLHMHIVRLFIAELNKQIRFSPICFYASRKVAFLKDVKSVHMDMHLLMKDINNFFGWQLLILTAHHIILITYSLFWIFLNVHYTGKSYSIAEASCTIFYCVIGVLALANSCEHCSLEAKDLLENVERYGFGDADNFQLNDIKNKLSGQIRHFSFGVTAKGWFTLNRKYLTNVGSGCCTYYIVLIQFLLSSSNGQRIKNETN